MPAKAGIHDRPNDSSIGLSRSVDGWDSWPAVDAGLRQHDAGSATRILRAEAVFHHLGMMRARRPLILILIRRGGFLAQVFEEMARFFIWPAPFRKRDHAQHAHVARQ
jgi:hypothetical protein